MFFLACFADPEPAPLPDLPIASISAYELDFGRVEPENSNTLELVIFNNGPGDIYLGLPTLLGGDDTFSVSQLPSTVISGPDGYVTLAVTFAPHTALDVSALLLIPTNDPAQPSIEVTLRASSTEGSIWFEPGFLDFGTKLLDCELTESLELVNQGDALVVIDSVNLSGSSFTLDTQEDLNGPFPWALPPGMRRPLKVSQQSATEGIFAGTLFATSEGMPQATATMSGTVLSSAFVEDTFPLDGGKVDIIIPVQAAEVYTDTASFTEGLPDFLDALDDLNIDYQIAIVMQSDGCVFGSDPFFSSSMSRAEQLAIYGVQINGTEWAHGMVVTMEAVKTAQTGPGGCNEGLLRPDARLAVIAFTYVGENHPDLGWNGAVNQIVAAKGSLEEVKIHGIIEDLYNGCGWGSHSFWSEAVEYTGGVWYSICDDIPTSMLDLAPELAAPPTEFVLSQQPDPATLEVRIDGDLADRWSYDEAENMVSVQSSLSGGGEVQISYELSQTCE